MSKSPTTTVSLLHGLGKKKSWTRNYTLELYRCNKSLILVLLGHETPIMIPIGGIKNNSTSGLVRISKNNCVKELLDTIVGQDYGHVPVYKGEYGHYKEKKVNALQPKTKENVGATEIRQASLKSKGSVLKPVMNNLDTNSTFSVIDSKLDTNSKLPDADCKLDIKDNPIHNTLSVPKDVEMVRFYNIKPNNVTEKENIHVFQNSGQTCYIGSSLQLLLHSKCKKIILDAYSKLNHVDKTKKTTLNTFCTMIQNRINTVDILQHQVAQLEPKFKSNMQQDAHEFLSCFLQQLHLETNILNSFKIFVKQIITCSHCSYQSIKNQVYHEIYVPIVCNPEIPVLNIQDLIKNEFKTQIIDYKCSCRGTTATMKMHVDFIPDILLVHIQRAVNGRKLVTPIDFNPYITGTCFPQCNSKEMFKLRSIISHVGTEMNYGHYICDVRTQDDIWTRFDDSRVSKVKYAHESSSNGYIALYERC